MRRAAWEAFLQRIQPGIHTNARQTLVGRNKSEWCWTEPDLNDETA